MSYSMRIGDWMQTYSGLQFWPQDPRPEEVSLIDIAHSLSMQCRFAGHCEFFYSVAQHSCLVAAQVAPDDRAWALLHDASEAYLVDLPRPVKAHSELGREYRRIEDRVMRAIAARFDLRWPMPETVKVADEIMLATEARDLMKPPPAGWTVNAKPAQTRILNVGDHAFWRDRMLQLCEEVGLR